MLDVWTWQQRSQSRQLPPLIVSSSLRFTRFPDSPFPSLQSFHSLHSLQSFQSVPRPPFTHSQTITLVTPIVSRIIQMKKAT
jgi:hypothetical protein